MKKIYFIILFAIASVVVNGQTCFWAKSMGGLNDQSGTSIAVDDSGNVFTTGFFSGTVDFDPGTGVFNLTSAPYSSFLCKLNASGNFKWAKIVGRPVNIMGNSSASSITLDKDGNIYTTGYFQDSCDFDPSSGTSYLVSSGSGDVFVSKLNLSGDLIWVKSMGGTDDELGQSISVDGLGNVYTSGSFRGIADFDPNSGTYNLISQGIYDNIFISKLDFLGNFIWANAIGRAGFSDDLCYIKTDEIGNVYATGRFQDSMVFAPSTGLTSLFSNGGYDIYMLKLNSNGSIEWVNGFGEVSDEYGESIVIDADKNIYVSGTFHGTIDFNPGVGVNNLISIANQDAFVCKYDSLGNYVWAKSFGGSSDEEALFIDIDNEKNVYTTGYFYNTVDFDPNNGVNNITSQGSSDIFISKLDSLGNFVWAQSMGGISNENAMSVAIDSNKNIYTTGAFSGTTDFDPYIGTYNLSANGYRDIFISKINNPLSAVISSITNVTCFGNNNGSASIVASGGTLPYTYLWNTMPSQTTTTATNLYAGIDTVTITESFGCTYKLPVMIGQPLPDTAKICVVTTDSTSHYNIIVWDKTPYANVDSFIVYRKDAFLANYLRIGAVSKDSLSQFIDTAFSIGGPNGGNPQYSSWLYKLAIRDTCGNIGAKSPYHQTMFVQQNGSNFSWNAYTVETGQANPVLGYSFLRDDNNIGNWHVLVNTVGLSATDPNYASFPNGNWRIDAIGFNCTSTMKLSSNNNVESNYMKSHSNASKPINTTGIKQVRDDASVIIYPNPSNGNFVVEVEKSKNSKIEVYSLMGELVYKADLRKDKNEINISALGKGVYLLHVVSDYGRSVKRIVIE